MRNERRCEMSGVRPSCVLCVHPKQEVTPRMPGRSSQKPERNIQEYEMHTSPDAAFDCSVVV